MARSPRSFVGRAVRVADPRLPKWVTRLTLLGHDEPGSWQRYGYHELGDP
jgi:hypothetical protein